MEKILSSEMEIAHNLRIILLILHITFCIENFTDVYSAEIILGAVARQHFNQPDAS